ncbi:DUF6151 family protein [Aestuariibacter sp. AA17]|uniref:DUF6151 family protein n=1 Tax=Fluctibacter corallii TaxID=2984329 RepID=A0ABT3A8X2_9ALTE|nr:DUF6151 family protein [Aestuariibacter sp. AA17]MCV2885039.1 DUF6151 family protein [Aestuariibacter sp. AA17]
MNTLKLSCRCGEIKGKIKDIDANSGNRLVCYCQDCQSFASALSQRASTLNKFGGTEIYQVAPEHLEITQGIDHIACMKLSAKGIHRWYSACCNTPICNTAGAKLPFVGIIHNAYHNNQNIGATCGPILGAVHYAHLDNSTQALVKGPHSHNRILLRIIRKLLFWKLTGKGKTSPFYNRLGKPICKPLLRQ